jgi:predicted XRE-type DNA-binding protein
MPQEQSHAASQRLLILAENIHDKRYRDGYVATHTRQVLAKQMREFRGEMPQTEFAELIGKRQTIVSRLENPSYTGWTLNTLFEIASKLNVAVFVRFVDFPTFLKYSGDQTETALHPASYDQRQVDDFARIESEQKLVEADILRALEITQPNRNEAARNAAQQAQTESMSRALFGLERSGSPTLTEKHQPHNWAPIPLLQERGIASLR